MILLFSIIKNPELQFSKNYPFPLRDLNPHSNTIRFILGLNFNEKNN